MITKTYGVRGLLEWHCVIPLGKACMRVDFTGGGLTAYGVTPAEFTTSDPVVQAVIENSEYYKSKRITLERQTGEAQAEQAPQPPKVGVADEAAEGEAEDSGLKKVSVASRADAVAYLKEHYGIPGKQVASKDALVKVAAANGIEFEGI